MDFEFNCKFPEGNQIITTEDLHTFADAIDLTRYAPGRFSWLFALKIYAHARVDGIDPQFILDQVGALEGINSHRGLKAATQFKHPPLAGLYHQHFFAPHFLVKNILNQLGSNKLDKIVKDVLKPMGAVTTEEMINEISYRATVQQIEDRGDQQKLTGEWIVFAKHEGQNYYLTVSQHTDPTKPEQDQALFREIEQVCYRQFPFLAQKTSP